MSKNFNEYKRIVFLKDPSDSFERRYTTREKVEGYENYIKNLKCPLCELEKDNELFS